MATEASQTSGARARTYIAIGGELLAGVLLAVGINLIAYIIGAIATAILLYGLLGWSRENIRNQTAGALMFLLIGSIIGGLVGYILWRELGAKTPEVSAVVPKSWKAATEVVIGHHFRNETVEIDGKKFIDCQFENVTLLYRGQGVADFIRTKWTGSVGLRTDHRAAKQFYALAHFLETIPDIQKPIKGLIDESGAHVPLTPAKRDDG